MRWRDGQREREREWDEGEGGWKREVGKRGLKMEIVDGKSQQFESKDISDVDTRPTVALEFLGSWWLYKSSSCYPPPSLPPRPPPRPPAPHLSFLFIYIISGRKSVEPIAGASFPAAQFESNPTTFQLSAE